VAIAEKGYEEVIGLELSETATQAAREYVAASSMKGKIKIITGDFFTCNLPELEGFDFVWDMTFFCAIDPSVRPSWGSVHHRLLKPGGSLACGMFPYSPGKVGGPPYHVEFDDYLKCLEGFVLEERQDKVAEGEEHRPGGFAGLGGPGTGLSIWVKR
jgi:methyl halide transferase